MKIKIKSQSNTGGSNNLTVIVFRSNIIFDDNTIINFGGKRLEEEWNRGVAMMLRRSFHRRVAVPVLLSSLIFDLFLRKQLTRFAFENTVLTLELAFG